MASARQARPIAASLDELVGDARREPFRTAESRSTTSFERVWVAGQPMVLKHLHLDHDFTMRSSGDIGCRPLRAWAAGLFDAVPDVIDHAVVGAASGTGRNGWGATFLMRDVSAELLPPGDVPFDEDHHHRFLDALAALCAATWGWHDDLGLLPVDARWAFFGPASLAAEEAAGWPEPVPRIAAGGWERFAERAPRPVVHVVRALAAEPHLLAGALAGTPACFLHGDWKASNLGVGRDGRTILLDWVYLGAGPPCHELAWYLALNRSRLPTGHTKERVIDDFRAALGRQGVDVTGWWERQLDLCLLGALVQFGWEKALGDDDELGWWCDRAASGAARL